MLIIESAPPSSFFDNKCFDDYNDEDDDDDDFEFDLGSVSPTSLAPKQISA